MNNSLDKLRLQLLWDRLLAIVEEQAQTLIRTAFSTTVRDAGDLSAGVFDTDGHMLSQAITGTPGHVHAMPAPLRFFLLNHPPATLELVHFLRYNPPGPRLGPSDSFV